MVLNKNFILDLFTTIMVVNIVYQLLLNLCDIIGVIPTLMLYTITMIYLFINKERNEQI